MKHIKRVLMNRKVVAVILAAAMVISVAAFSPVILPNVPVISNLIGSEKGTDFSNAAGNNAEMPAYRCGDVMGNGEIAIFDFIEILVHLVGMNTSLLVDTSIGERERLLARRATLLTPTSRSGATVSSNPQIFDGIEILLVLVGIPPELLCNSLQGCAWCNACLICTPFPGAVDKYPDCDCDNSGTTAGGGTVATTANNGGGTTPVPTPATTDATTDESSATTDDTATTDASSDTTTDDGSSDTTAESSDTTPATTTTEETTTTPVTTTTEESTTTTEATTTTEETTTTEATTTTEETTVTTEESTATTDEVTETTDEVTETTTEESTATTDEATETTEETTVTTEESTATTETVTTEEVKCVPCPNCESVVCGNLSCTKGFVEGEGQHPDCVCEQPDANGQRPVHMPRPKDIQTLGIQDGQPENPEVKKDCAYPGCTQTNVTVCPRCTYCRDCDWWYFGTVNCSDCGFGSDCIASAQCNHGKCQLGGVCLKKDEPEPGDEDTTTRTTRNDWCTECSKCRLCCGHGATKLRFKWGEDAESLGTFQKTGAKCIYSDVALHDGACKTPGDVVKCNVCAGDNARFDMCITCTAIRYGVVVCKGCGRHSDCVSSGQSGGAASFAGARGGGWCETCGMCKVPNGAAGACCTTNH